MRGESRRRSVVPRWEQTPAQVGTTDGKRGNAFPQLAPVLECLGDESIPPSESPMSTAHDDVLKSALSLPESDRIRLATELLDSLPGTPPGLSIEDPDFLKELERRANDPAPGIPWEEIQRKLQGKLHK